MSSLQQKYQSEVGGDMIEYVEIIVDNHIDLKEKTNKALGPKDRLVTVLTNYGSFVLVIERDGKK